MITYTNLLPFCSKVPFRKTITKPFLFEGSYIATNGRVLVSLEHAPEGWRDPGGDYGADLAGLRAEFERADPARPAWEHPAILPAGKEPTKNCVECHGTGWFKHCAACAGAGEITCDSCQHRHTCSECNGAGGKPSRDKDQPGMACEECDGSGVIYPTVFVRAYGAGFDNKYLEMIHANLPRIETVQESSGYCAAKLNFPGGFVLLMPVRFSDYEPYVLPASTAEQYAAAVAPEVRT